MTVVVALESYFDQISDTREIKSKEQQRMIKMSIKVQKTIEKKIS